MILPALAGVTLKNMILPALAGVNFRFDAGVFEGDILPRGVFGVLDLGLGLLATLEKRVD